MEADRKSPSLGSKIRLQRRGLCLTQDQLADAVGVSQAAVARWESDSTVPHLRNRLAIGAALGVAPAILFAEVA